ncbi:hypothetical protein CPB97_003160 [Podila verticillata]|nr:hypothetical protein CPB97_003160 [Podila verticillata]
MEDRLHRLHLPLVHYLLDLRDDSDLDSRTRHLMAFHQGSFLQSNMGGSTQRTTNMHRSILKTGDDNDTETSTDKDDDDDDDEVTSQDESEPLRQQIKQLHLEDVLAFLPIGGPNASGVLPEAGKRPDSRNEVPGYQRRTVLGDKMPFQLDEELADLGTRPLEEILNHNDDDGDLGEEDDRGHGYGEHSSVTQSAMEDAYLSGYNNSKTSLFMHSSTRN